MQIKSIKIKDVLQIIQGNLVKGQIDQEISAVGSSGLSFAFSKKALADIKSKCLVIASGMQHQHARADIVIKVENPRLAMAKFLTFITSTEVPSVIASSATIHKSAKIAANVSIGANVVIEAEVEIADNCSIGANTVVQKASKILANVQLKPNVTIYPNTVIGENTIIHANSVVGSDGFGYEQLSNKSWFKIPHVGNVVIGPNTEIGACTTIDRGTTSSTIIGAGVKIDNHCQIAHNVKIGDHVLISGCSAIAGSTIIEANVILGGRVSVADHLYIKSGVIIKGASTVLKDIKTPGLYGSAISVLPDKIWNRSMILLASLPKLFKTVRNLEHTNDN